jgi:drug/metabolite transporter (DMT)-like permease
MLNGSELPTQAGMRSFAAMFYLGVFGSFVGYVAYYYVLRQMQASSAMLITLMTPVIALYLGRAINNEVLHSGVWLGSVLVLSGLMIYLWTTLKTVLFIGLPDE